MRLYNIVTENRKDLDKTQPDVLAKWVFKSCKKYFSMIGPDQHLYRGRRNSSEFAFKGASPAERRPKDSVPEIQDMCDALMAQRGVIARRGNSIFTTGDRKFADKFGEVYEIFPIGDFHYTWLKNTREIIIEPYDGLSKGYMSFTPSFKAAARELAKDIQANPENYPYAQDLVRYIENIDEKPASVYASELPLQLRNWFSDASKTYIFNYDKFSQRYGIVSDEELSTAIESGHEIFINGKYYAIGLHNSYDFFWSVLNRLRDAA